MFEWEGAAAGVLVVRAFA